MPNLGPSPTPTEPQTLVTENGALKLLLGLNPYKATATGTDQITSR